MKKILRYSGFTLLELMITVALLAILVAIAAPSFEATVKKNRVESVQRDLKSALNLARSEAVSRGSFITLCGSNDGATCNDSSNWSNGWLIFIDSDTLGELESGEEILKISESESNQIITLTDADGDALKVVGFNQRGYLNDAINPLKLTVKVCAPTAETQYARSLLLNLSGRVVDGYDTDSNGISEDINGNDLSC